MSLNKSQKERWRRWLGAVTRKDMPTWVELLSGDWSGWPNRVLRDKATRLNWQTCSREDVKAEWAKAIEAATPEQLLRLDVMFIEDRMSKQAKRAKRRKR